MDRADGPRSLVVSIDPAPCSQEASQTYPDHVTVLFVKLFELQVLLMSLEHHSGDVET